ncbi:Uncharacterised protein [Yersinia massiliensis]|nr:Uncharacterised protein [Yersinia massiliensis]
MRGDSHLYAFLFHQSPAKCLTPAHDLLMNAGKYRSSTK